MNRTNGLLVISIWTLLTQSIPHLALSQIRSTDSPLPSPIVIAHRGASGYLPEHTLASVAMAHAMQADFIEQDIVLTKDDVPVVLHDIHLDTVTNVRELFPQRIREDGRFYAIDFSLAEIKQLNASERIDLKTNKAVFPSRFPPATGLFQVPTLAEEIELIQGLNKSTQRSIGIYVEIKHPAWHRQQGKDISNIVLATLKQYGYVNQSDRAYVQCFDAEETKRIRTELNCRLRLVQLVGKKKKEDDTHPMLTEQGIKLIATYADGIGPAMNDVLPPTAEQPPKVTRLVAFAHKAGLVVHPYTFRADAVPPYASDFKELVSLFREAGIDGFFTDFPDQLRAALHEAH
jgi:glycerophosphoryl diester phosphodiesterase